MATSPATEFPRLTRLPPYIFNITTELKMAARRRGEDIIDFGMGNPDGPTPKHIVDKLVETALRPDTHGYSVSKGIPRLRRAICHWYERRWGVSFDPETEAIVTIGSKEGIAHLTLATLGRGDTVLVPNPSYPIHIYGPVIAGADIRHVPMTPDGDFFAELERTIHTSFPKPKMLIVSFPSNPTAQCVELPFFEKLVALAKEYGIWVVHDLAYADICFDGWKAPSIMQVPGARDVAVEFFTMSKSYNMAGWRIGYMVGSKDLVYALSRIKGYHDYGTFTPIQVAAIAALEGPQDCVTRDRSQLPAAARRAGQGAARGRLDGRQPEGVDVRLGARSRALPRRRLARVREGAAGEGEGLRLAGDRLRRVRRRVRALRDDREREPHAPGDSRHQADVPRRRPALRAEARCSGRSRLRAHRCFRSRRRCRRRALSGGEETVAGGRQPGREQATDAAGRGGRRRGSP